MTTVDDEIRQVRDAIATLRRALMLLDAAGRLTAGVLADRVGAASVATEEAIDAAQAWLDGQPRRGRR